MPEIYFTLKGAIDRKTPQLIYTNFARAHMEGYRTAHLLVASNGGNYNEATEIRRYLKTCGFFLTTYCEERVMSAGLTVFLAGRKRIGSAGSYFMMHRVTNSLPERLPVEEKKRVSQTEAEYNARILKEAENDGVTLTTDQLGLFKTDDLSFCAPAALRHGIIHSIGRFIPPNALAVRTVQETQ